MLAGKSPIRLYDGLILPNGQRVPFLSKVSKRIKVVDNTPRNHPAYNLISTKRVIATRLIGSHKFIGSFGGKLVDLGKNSYEKDDRWHPDHIFPKTGENYYVDASEGGNEMRYINDVGGVTGGKPNVKFYESDGKLQGYYTIDIYSIEDIQPGEEILTSCGVEYQNNLMKWWKNPHVCSQCNYRTNTSAILEKHVRDNHGVEQNKREIEIKEAVVIPYDPRRNKKRRIVQDDEDN